MAMSQDRQDNSAKEIISISKKRRLRRSKLKAARNDRKSNLKSIISLDACPVINEHLKIEENSNYKDFVLINLPKNLYSSNISSKESDHILPENQLKSNNQPYITVGEIKTVVDNLKMSSGGEAVKTREQINAERAARKAEKQAKKKGGCIGDVPLNQNNLSAEVVDTLKEIVNIAKEVQEVKNKVESIDLSTKKPEVASKSKSELRAERRAKQEAQRAAKQAGQQQKNVQNQQESTPKPEVNGKLTNEENTSEIVKKDKISKKSTIETQNESILKCIGTPVNLDSVKDKLSKIPLSTKYHQAIKILAARQASNIVTGSNGSCLALLYALKELVNDYSPSANPDYVKGLHSELRTNLEFLTSVCRLSAAQCNAIRFLTHQMTRLPKDAEEAQQKLKDEIERYIREQINMAAESVCVTTRKKISPGDLIVTYECSDIVSRVFMETMQAGVEFDVVVCGRRNNEIGLEMERELLKNNVSVSYVDFNVIGHLMKSTNKVLIGASSLLKNERLHSGVGTAMLTLIAQFHNVPVMVACETHKFSRRIQINTFLFREIGDPEVLLTEAEEQSVLKNLQINGNITVVNFSNDLVPPPLVDAVVTEIDILPCTSAPSVLKTKRPDYGSFLNL